MKFKELNVGDTFDFISSDGYNSFSGRCEKVSPRKYKYEDWGGKWESQVGTINVEVFHVRQKNDESKI